MNQTGDKTLVNKDAKDATELLMSLDHTPHILQGLFLGCSRYKIDYPWVNSISEWAPTNKFNVQRYYPGQGYFGPHCENSSKNNPRVMAWMFYLNTVTDGGQTRFISYDLNVNPVEGRLVIWPAFWTHIHHGITSETQTKYIATGWFQYV